MRFLLLRSVLPWLSFLSSYTPSASAAANDRSAQKLGAASVMLKQQGYFPVHHKNGTFNFKIFDRHLDGLLTKYARSTASQGSIGEVSRTSRREVRHAFMDYEPDGMMWKVEIQLGQQHLDVELDTTAPDCFVEPSAYDPSESEHATNRNDHFNNAVVHGRELSGAVWMDTMQIAGLIISDVIFGLAQDRFMPQTYHADGLCGLAMPDQTVLDDEGFFFTMLTNEMLDNPMFGMALSRHTPSELTFGAVNPSLFEDLTFVPVVGTSGFWQIPAVLVAAGASIPMEIILDSTSRSIVMRPELAILTFRLLGVRALRRQSGRLIGVYACSRPPTVEFRFGERILSLRSADVYMGHFDRDANECILSIVGRPDANPEVIAGHPLFLSTYLAFRTDPREIGIGPRTQNAASGMVSMGRATTSANHTG
ncbi:hypothetical protein V8E36_006272 [Tilletia maclaganii]